MGCQHAANRTLIGCAIGVSADGAENWAGVQASPTTNTVQHVTLFCVGQKFAAPVIEQHNMEFLRAVALVLGPRTADERVVTSNRLSRPCRCQTRPENRPIVEAWNYFLNTDQGHMNLRQTRSQASVAFVRGDS